MSEEVESLRWYDGGPPFYVAPTLTKPRACDTAIEWVVNLAFLRLNEFQGAPMYFPMDEGWRNSNKSKCLKICHRLKSHFNEHLRAKIQWAIAVALCLKTTQNVVFEFFNFGTVWPQASSFQIGQIGHFWHFYWTYVRSLRNVELDFFCDFQTPCVIGLSTFLVIFAFFKNINF